MNVLHKVPPGELISHHLSAISMAAVYADGRLPRRRRRDGCQMGLKQDAHSSGSSDEE